MDGWMDGWMDEWIWLSLARFGSFLARFCSIWLDFAQVGSVFALMAQFWLGFAQIGSISLGFAQLGVLNLARFWLGSAQIGSALGAQFSSARGRLARYDSVLARCGSLAWFKSSGSNHFEPLDLNQNYGP